MSVRDQVLSQPQESQEVPVNIPGLTTAQRHVMLQSYLLAIKSAHEMQLRLVNDALAIMAVEADEEPQGTPEDAPPPFPTMGQEVE